jgi:hypothetical protein
MTVSLLLPIEVEAQGVCKYGWTLSTTIVGGEKSRICIPPYLVIDHNIIPPAELHINPIVLAKMLQSGEPEITITQGKGYDNLTLKIPDMRPDSPGGNLTKRFP